MACNSNSKIGIGIEVNSNSGIDPSPGKDLPDSDRGDFRWRRAVDSSSFIIWYAILIANFFFCSSRAIKINIQCRYNTIHFLKKCSQWAPHSSLKRARYGVLCASSKSDSHFTQITAVMYTVCCYIKPQHLNVYKCRVPILSHCL